MNFHYTRQDGFYANIIYVKCLDGMRQGERALEFDHFNCFMCEYEIRRKIMLFRIVEFSRLTKRRISYMWQQSNKINGTDAKPLNNAKALHQLCVRERVPIEN